MRQAVDDGTGETMFAVERRVVGGVLTDADDDVLRFVDGVLRHAHGDVHHLQDAPCRSNGELPQEATVGVAVQCWHRFVMAELGCW